MKSKLILSFVTLVLASACGRDGSAGTSQKDYEVVQEGSANGVTSTIQGPGETLPPITSTSADTTTAFSIDPTLATPQQSQTGSLSGAMPPVDAYTPPAPPPAYIPPTPRPAPPVAPRPAPPEPEPAPERTEPQPPPTTTETAVEPEPPAEPEEEEAEEQPPPPTTTDTRGPNGNLGLPV